MKRSSAISNMPKPGKKDANPFDLAILNEIQAMQKNKEAENGNPAPINSQSFMLLDENGIPYDLRYESQHKVSFELLKKSGKNNDINAIENPFKIKKEEKKNDGENLLKIIEEEKKEEEGGEEEEEKKEGGEEEEEKKEGGEEEEEEKKEGGEEEEEKKEGGEEEKEKKEGGEEEKEKKEKRYYKKRSPSVTKRDRRNPDSVARKDPLVKKLKKILMATEEIVQLKNFVGVLYDNIKNKDKSGVDNEVLTKYEEKKHIIEKIVELDLNK